MYPIFHLGRRCDAMACTNMPTCEAIKWLVERHLARVSRGHSLQVLDGVGRQSAPL